MKVIDLEQKRRLAFEKDIEYNLISYGETMPSKEKLNALYLLLNEAKKIEDWGEAYRLVTSGLERLSLSLIIDSMELLDLPEHIETASQNCDCNSSTQSCSYKRIEIDGKIYKRKRHGKGEFTSSCHDCSTTGSKSIHHYGCDMESCPKCEGQLSSCDCEPSKLSE